MSTAPSGAPLLLGAAAATHDLRHEGRAHLLARHFDLVVPEYEMKWDQVAPRPAARDAVAADALVTFAGAHGLACRGHALWWHGAVPAWLAGAGRAAVRAEALAHLAWIAGRYAGRLHSWDVVNEPLDLANGRSDGLRASPFLDAFGPGYLALAFREAARTDPGALLVLNEMGLEYDSPDAAAKRRAMLRLLERHLAAGVPIQGLGLQSHLDAADRPRAHPALQAFAREVEALGLRLLVTELDVSDARCPRDRAARDRMVAQAYWAYLSGLLEACRPAAVVVWGVSDARTWLATSHPRPDGAPVRPLPFDRAGRRKAAFAALAAALGRGEGARAGHT